MIDVMMISSSGVLSRHLCHNKDCVVYPYRGQPRRCVAQRGVIVSFDGMGLE